MRPVNPKAVPLVFLPGREAMLLHREASKRWSIAELPSCVGLSQSRLDQPFKSHVGITPVAYLRTQRVDAMAELLASTTIGVAEAARKVRFTNPATASRVFSQRYGVAPLRYAQATIRSSALTRTK